RQREDRRRHPVLLNSLHRHAINLDANIGKRINDRPGDRLQLLHREIGRWKNAEIIVRLRHEDRRKQCVPRRDSKMALYNRHHVSKETKMFWLPNGKMVLIANNEWVD